MRLFDSAKKKALSPEERRAQESEALAAAALDAESKQLSNYLGEQRAVEAIHYQSERRGKWRIEHAQVGDDYVYQMFPITPAKYVWQDVIALFIKAMESVFPRSVQIFYKPPSEFFTRFDRRFSFFTIKVARVGGLPGGGRAVQKALEALFATDVW